MTGRRGFSYGFVAFSLLAATAARAEGEFMRDAMSNIGLVEPERAPITYNERAPLVMPPSLGSKGAAKAPGKGAKNAAKGLDTNVPLTLPPPQTREADPQWPKDPEITQRDRAAAEARKPIVRGAQGRMNDNNMTLSVDEMQGGRRAGAGGAAGPDSRMSDTRESNWLNPLQLFSGRKEDEGPSQVEPQRGSLSDPPNGYRKTPVKVEHVQAGPVGGSISGNEEADPRNFQRAQGGR